jgi:hypothetical protein
MALGLIYQEEDDSEKNGGPESSKTRRELKGKQSEDVQPETGSFDDRISSLPALDAASLFWFRKPRLVLKIFQYLLFQNSLSISLAIYNFWQVRNICFKYFVFSCVGLVFCPCAFLNPFLAGTP